MSSALVFIFVLGVLVVIHEFGHFIVARWVGIRVDKFSIGFGPVIFGKKIGETEFCVSLLPLGGFVKMAGENPEDSQGKPWEFNSKSLLQKFAVVFAGPLMNAFLAFVIFSAIFMVGQPTLTTKVGKVMKDAPASNAGILEGDVITALDGQKVTLWEEALSIIQKSQKPVLFTIQREGVEKQITVAPQVREARDVFGKKVSVSFVGVAPSSEMVYLKNNFFEALGLGFDRVWKMTGMIFYSLWLMITGAMSFKDSVTGPIGIFFMTQQAAQLGVIYLLYFMASLSVSLFVLNLLPIPVLDGGHVLFILIEKIKGSPLKDSVKEKMTQAGLVALLALMAFVIFQDIHRFSVVENVLKLFGGGK
jgi:regulator of sigma E protease